ncbi:MAG TPA: 16S rRNA (guanine(966)-N(2))-methyltransferase RsmD [bacterium]
MRVSGGIARGRRLKTLKHRILRPTTERVRQAIFNILGSERIENKDVLDLFAGSGALGIDAISRGAVRAEFVEQNKIMCNLIKKNLAELRLLKYTKVRHGDVLKEIETILNEGKKFGLIFADPPYGKGFVNKVLSQVASGDILEKEGVFVLEHSKNEMPEPAYGNIVKVFSRRYGDTLVSLFARGQYDI